MNRIIRLEEKRKKGEGKREKGKKPSPIYRLPSTALKWLLCLFLMLAMAAPAEAAWLSGWDKRIKLTIDHDKITADLSDFPVLVYLSASSGIGNIDTSCVFDELGTNDNRKKIAVTKSDGTTECYVEIEKWDHTNEQAFLWVKVSGTNSITAASDTVLYLYYDASHANNTTYVGDSGSRTEVWDEDGVSEYFKMVQHLEETPGDGVQGHYDSTSNDNDGTPYNFTDGGGGTTNGTGKIDGADEFAGDDDYVDCGKNASLEIKGTLTYEAWIKPSASSAVYQIIMQKYLSTAGNALYFLNGSIKRFYGRIDYGTGTDAVSKSNEVITVDVWQHVAMTFENNIVRLYINGQEVTYYTQTAGVGTEDDLSTRTVKLGQSTSVYAFAGTIDEVRISSTARSAAWIETSYHSGVTSGSNSLLTYGDTSVVTQEATNITSATAVLNGDLITDVDCDQRGFEWGTSTGVYGSSWEASGTDYGTGTYSHEITGLSAGTTYYYRAKAHNAAGWAYGAEKSFVLWVAGYSYRKKITIDNSKVDGALTNFPVLVKLTSSNFDFNRVRSDGYDIRFASSDGTTLLKYERERHNSTSQAAEYWVKIPSVSSSTDTAFYMYYGKDNATDGADAANVWDSSFKMVQHLEETSKTDGTYNDHIDSTSNNNDGEAENFNGIPTSTMDGTGQIDGADVFDGTDDYVDCGNDTSLDITHDFAIEAWIKMDVLGNRIVDKYYHALKRAYALGIAADDVQLMLGTSDGSSSTTYTTTDLNLAVDTWYHIVATLGSDNTIRIYKNGVASSNTWSRSDNFSTNEEPVTIGKYLHADVYKFDGQIDEVRISSTARLAEWIKASYYSGKDELLSYDNEDQTRARDWLGSNWRYRKQMSLTGSTAGAQTNYQMKLTVHSGSGTDSSSDVYLNSHGQNDFDDIRFTTYNGATLLDYWIESKTDSDNAVVWVEFDYIPESPETVNFYIYYGNDSASSASEGDSTFVFFDDFEGTTVDSVKWPNSAESPAVASSILSLNATTTVEGISTTSTFANNSYVLRYYAKQDNTAALGKLGFSNTAAITTSYTTDDSAYLNLDATTGGNFETGTTNEGAAEDSVGDTTAEDTSYHTFEVIPASSSTVFKTDGAVEKTHSTQVPDEAMYVRLEATDTTNTISVDWVFVRKYASADPTWSAWASEESGETWYNFDWQYREKIVIDHTKIDSDLADFPVLVKLTSSNFDFSKARSDGYDVHFTAADGAAFLEYERERHNQGSSLAEYWVKLPYISSTEDTEIYLYYGKPDQTTDLTTAANVWDSSFKMVQHLEESPSDGVQGHYDSTSNDNDGTPYNFTDGGGGTTNGTGKIDGADEFAGDDDYVDCGYTGISGSSGTIEVWVNMNDWTPTSVEKFIMLYTDGSNFIDIFNNSFGLYFRRRADGTIKQVIDSAIASYFGWHHLVMTWDKSADELKAFFDGKQDGTTQTGIDSFQGSISSLSISSQTDTLTGTIDEVRISDTARSAAWIKAAYNSESDTLLKFYSPQVETGWPADYDRRKQVTVSGSTDGGQTKYQMKLTVYKGSGTDSGSSVYLGGNCQDDFDDVRFTSADGTPLDFWRESYTSGTSAVFWIEVDFIPGAPDSAEFYVYYDNDSAASASDGDSAFEFFDDFPGTSVDSTKWPNSAESPAVGSSILSLNATTTVEGISTTGTFANNSYILRYYAKQDNTAALGKLGFSNTATVTTSYTTDDSAYLNLDATTGGNFETSTTNEGTAQDEIGAITAEDASYHTFEVIPASSSTVFKTDGTVEKTHSTQVPDEAMNVRLEATDTVNTISVDWVAVRKYVSDEPAWENWGEEQLAEGVSDEAAWLAGYSYRKELTIDHSKVDELLTDFPVLVKLTASNFTFSQALSTGYDIRFTSSDGTTLLKYERERHNQGSSLAEYWVKIPVISGSSETKFFMYYGNANAADGADTENVWDANFKMVQHLEETASSPVPTSLDWQVGASTDDAEQDGATMVLALNAISLLANDDWGGFRWTGVNIPAGATITSAYIRIYLPDKNDDFFDGKTVYCQNANNPGTFTDTLNDISGRTRTTNSASLGSGAKDAGWENSLSLVDLVQEVVTDQSGTGDALVVIIDSTTGDDLDISAYDNDTSLAAELYIEYTVDVVTVVDSTSNDNDSTSNSADATTSGQIDGAMDFTAANSDYITLGNIGTAKTLSFWMSPDSTTESILEELAATGVSVSAGTMSYTNWDNCYVDGVDTDTVTTGWHQIALTSTTDVTMSAHRLGLVNTIYLDGILDEVRISSTARSAAWIKAGYNSGNDSLISYGDGQYGSGQIKVLDIKTGGTVTLNNSAELNINGDIGIHGTLASDSSAVQIYVSGSWINWDGTFTSGGSTVTFDGTAAQRIASGDSDWNDIVVTNTCANSVKFEDGFSVDTFTATSAGSVLYFQSLEQYEVTGTVDNSLTITGAEGNQITLARLNGANDEQWGFYPSGTTTWNVDYVTVSDSANLNSTAIEPTNYTNSGNTINWFAATLVDLVSFNAIGLFGRVELTWQTESEIGNAGYNLYRNTEYGIRNTEYERINKILIPGLGDSAVGKAYSYIDYDVTDGETYYYKLEAVEYTGSSEIYGPVMARPGLDSDGDGLSDDWEKFYGLNPYDPTDASLDPDGDGLTNLEEFSSGTNPMNKDTAQFSPEEAFEGVKILSIDKEGIILELWTRGFELEEKKIDGEIYQRITLPGYIHGESNEENRPLVPIKGVLLAVPQEAALSFQILETEPFSYSEYNLSPAAGEALIIEDTLYPSVVAELNAVSRLRSQRVAQINFHPIQYNSETKDLTLNKRIKVKLCFADGGTDEGIVTDTTLDKFDDIFAHLIENYTNAGDWQGYPEGWSGKLNPEASFAEVAAKISIKEDGIYRVTGTDLEAAGINLKELEPPSLKLYNEGDECAIRLRRVNAASFSTKDYIEFYGQKKETKYTDTNVYWLVNTAGEGLRMAETSALPAEGEPEVSFLATQHQEENALYWSEQPGEDEAERWLYQLFIGSGIDWATPGSLAFNLSNLDTACPENSALLEVVLWGFFNVEPSEHYVKLFLNEHLLTETGWAGRAEQRLSIEFPQGYLNEGANTLGIESVLPAGADYDLILIDWFRVSYWKKFAAEGDVCEFAGLPVGQSSGLLLTGFTLPQIGLYDISAGRAPIYLTEPAVIAAEDGSYQFSFGADFAKGLALAEPQIKTPAAIEKNEPSSLQVIFQQADYLIITPAIFYDEILPLAELRAAQGLAVKVVKLEDIYDEFNFGISSPHPIKDFLSFTYKFWLKPAPTYVLLVGDATYDYKYFWGEGTKTFLPTYHLVTPYLGETASDNWFVCLDEPQELDGRAQDDFLPDMFIGRFPVKSEDEVIQTVNKIFTYETAALTGWEKRALFVSDNADDSEEDSAMFEEISDLARAILPSDYQAAMVYLSAYGTPEACTADIINYFNQGSLLLNYVGHGAIDIWANEYIFENAHLESISNTAKYPFVVTVTCLNGLFTQPFSDCLAEAMFLPAEKGAIACWAPSGMGEKPGHKLLDTGLFEAIFKDKHYALGAATTQAKIKLFAESGRVYKDLIQTFCLFGDPALKLPISLPAIEEVTSTVIAAPEDEEEEPASKKKKEIQIFETKTKKKQTTAWISKKRQAGVAAITGVMPEEIGLLAERVNRTLQLLKAKLILREDSSEEDSQEAAPKKLLPSQKGKPKTEYGIRNTEDGIRETPIPSAFGGATGQEVEGKPRRTSLRDEQKAGNNKRETGHYRKVIEKYKKDKGESPKAGLARLLDTFTKNLHLRGVTYEVQGERSPYLSNLKERYEKLMQEKIGDVSAAEVMEKTISEIILGGEISKELGIQEEELDKLSRYLRKNIKELINKLTKFLQKLLRTQER